MLIFNRIVDSSAVQALKCQYHLATFHYESLITWPFPSATDGKPNDSSSDAGADHAPTTYTFLYIFAAGKPAPQRPPPPRPPPPLTPVPDGQPNHDSSDAGADHAPTPCYVVSTLFKEYTKAAISLISTSRPPPTIATTESRPKDLALFLCHCQSVVGQRVEYEASEAEHVTTRAKESGLSWDV